MKYINCCTGLTATNERFSALLLEHPVRGREGDLLDQFQLDMAASVQLATEEIVTRLVKSLIAETGSQKLCLAGVVALNCVANGKLLREGVVRNLWVQRTAGDAGGALGASLLTYHHYKQR